MMNINIDEIKKMVKANKPVSTGMKDIDGNEIFLGTRLFKVDYSPLTYEIRIRLGSFVLHTGGCYSILNEANAKKCRINNNLNLRSGEQLFNDKLIS